jgi:Flp pilus assembly pilin Flp
MFPRSRYVFLDNHGSLMDDRGTVTIEYALVAIAAAAIAVVLFTIVHSGGVEAGLTSLIERSFDFRG